MKDGEFEAKYDVPLRVLVTNEALEVVHASAAFLGDFGCAREDVVGLELSELFSHQDRRATVLLDRTLSRVDARRADLIALLDVAGRTHLSRLTLTRDGRRWVVVVEILDGGDNLIFDLYNDQRRWAAAIKGSSDGIVFLDPQGRIIEYNARFVDLLQFRSEHGVLITEEALLGTELHTLLADRGVESIRARVAALKATTQRGERFVLGERTLDLRLQPLLLPGVGVVGHAVMFRDVSDRLRADAEREERLRDQLRHHEEVIAAQQQAIRELTAPLIPLTRELTVVPFVGALDGARVDESAGHILQGVAGTSTRTMVLDLTGVTDLDASAAGGLVRLAQSLQLIGVRTVLTGISPRAAQLLGEQPAVYRLAIRGSVQDALASLLR